VAWPRFIWLRVRWLVKCYSTCKITVSDDNIKMEVKTSRLGWRDLDLSGWGYAGLLNVIRRVKLLYRTIILKRELKTSRLGWRGLDSSGWGYAGFLNDIRRVKLLYCTIILKWNLKQVGWCGLDSSG